MNDIDRMVAEHIVLGVSLPKEAREQLSLLSEIGTAALGLGATPDVLERWFTTLSGEPSRLEAIVALQIDREDVTDRVDEILSGPGAALVACDLVRAGVPWAHPRLPHLLEEDDARFAAAWLLASTADPGLDAWLEESDEAEHAEEALRAAALLGVEDYLEAARNWRSYVDGYPGVAHRFEALIAMISPEQFARSLFSGEVSVEWLSEPRLVADYLHSVGFVSWLDTLGFLEIHGPEDAFEFAAALGIAGAAGASGTVESDTEAESLIALLEGAADWEPVANRPEMGLPMALGDDSEMQQLFVEVASHERLMASEFHSPGIPGLPLSATSIDAERVGAAEIFLNDLAENDDPDDDAIVGGVRTLCDLAVWHVEESEYVRSLIPRADALSSHPQEAIAQAARHALGEVPQQGKGPSADGESCAALLATERLISRHDDASLRELVSLWVDGPIARAEVYRNALWEALEARVG